MDQSASMLKAAKEAWDAVRAVLLDPDQICLSDACVVDSCLSALKGTIPNFLFWSGIEDFQGHKFWESPRARAALGIDEGDDVGTVVFALEGLALKAKGDRLAAEMAALEEKRIAYLKESWERGPGSKLAADTCRWGRTTLLEQALRTFDASTPGSQKATPAPMPSVSEGPA